MSTRKSKSTRDGAELAPAIGVGPSMVVTGGNFATEEEMAELEKHMSPKLKTSMQAYHDMIARIRKGPSRPPAAEMVPYVKPVVNTDFIDDVPDMLAERVQEAFNWGAQGMADMEARERKAIAERDRALKDLIDLSMRYAAMEETLRNLTLCGVGPSGGPPPPRADAEDADADDDGQPDLLGAF